MPKSPEEYKPTKEEMKRAEKIMTPEQAKLSKIREVLHRFEADAGIDFDEVRGRNIMLRAGWKQPWSNTYEYLDREAGVPDPEAGSEKRLQFDDEGNPIVRMKPYESRRKIHDFEWQNTSEDPIIYEKKILPEEALSIIKKIEEIKSHELADLKREIKNKEM